MVLLRLPGVYRPQADTTLLCETLATVPVPRAARVLDVGTGTGAVAVVAAASGATVTAVDNCRRAVLTTVLNSLVRRLPVTARRGLEGRYEAALAHLRGRGPETVLAVFLGSNLGNGTPSERDALLADIADTLRPGDGFLVSADLQKPTAVLEDCYNDPPDRSAFARFRLNYLTHLNHRFDGDFTPEYFYPRAHYDLERSAVRAQLYATERHTVRLRDLDVEMTLRRGDSLNVGISYKFHRPELVADIAGRGFELRGQWIDAVWQYGIFLFVRAGS